MTDWQQAGGGLIALDSSWTYDSIRKRGTEDSVLCRDLDGFFDHVWTVHPFASMLTSPQVTAKFGKPALHKMSDRHTFIDGKVGWTPWLRSVFALNFLLSQVLLFFSLLRLARRRRVKVIRAGDPLYTGLFGWALSRAVGIPLVVRIPSNNDKIREDTGQPISPRLFRREGVEKRVERFVLSRADLVAGANGDNLQFALDNGADPARSTIFRYGNLIARQHLQPPHNREVDPALLCRLGLEPHRFLLCIARLDPVKAVDDAVRVLARVRKQGFDVKLAIVGDGQMAPNLAGLATELGVAPYLVMPGNQPQSVLAQLIVVAACVLSPHTGRALTEAAFGAAPVVAYDIDWQKELIEADVTGDIVAFREVEAMASATVRMLADPGRAAALGEALRTRAFDMLNPARLNDHERASYRAVLAR